ncbi:MAG: hypothetical protein ACC660_08540 [Acidimicrobiales bacterium]
MQQFNDALDVEIHELDTVLLRLTTLRLLMATGKHGLVDRAVDELGQSMEAFEAAERRAIGALDDCGFQTIDEAAAAQEVDVRVGLERRAATLRARHRDVRVALATTGAAAERSLRQAAQHISGDVAARPLAHNRHPFLTGE